MRHHKAEGHTGSLPCTVLHFHLSEHALLVPAAWFCVQPGFSTRRRCSPGVVPPATAWCGCNSPALLERGRYPTGARQVGVNPRRTAGATVVSAGRRLFRCQRATGERKCKKGGIHLMTW